MKELEQKAIQLRYEGATYKEISKALGGRFSEGTLRHLFASDGLWYMDYLTYEAERNKFNEEEVRSKYKKMLGWTWKIQQELLQHAIKDKDYRLAWNIIQDINDRAGLVVVRKSEVNVKDEPARPISNKEFFAELARLGIDSRTGLRLGIAEDEKN